MLVDIQGFFQWIANNFGIVLTGLTVLVGIMEKSKSIAWKPITKFFKWIGKTANQELYNKVDDVEKQTMKIQKHMGQLEDKVDENERDRIRQEILSFANSLRDGKEHTKDEFQHIQELYYKYHEKLRGNGLITEEYEYIRSIYLKIYNRTLDMYVICED